MSESVCIHVKHINEDGLPPIDDKSFSSNLSKDVIMFKSDFSRCHVAKMIYDKGVWIGEGILFSCSDYPYWVNISEISKVLLHKNTPN